MSEQPLPEPLESFLQGSPSLPPSVGVGRSVARSGTTCVPSTPPTRLKVVKPSFVMIVVAQPAVV